MVEEAAIQADLVAGTSAGSLVAALWAAGLDGAALGRLAQTMDEAAMADWSYPGRSLLRGEALARYVRRHTGERLIEQMVRPLGIVALRVAQLGDHLAEVAVGLQCRDVVLGRCQAQR